MAYFLYLYRKLITGDQIAMFKTYVVALLSLLALGLTGCEDGKSSSGGRNYYSDPRLANQQIWTTSPQGSNCVYNGTQYVEVFQSGYSYSYSYSYGNGVHPYNMYTTSGGYNQHYRDPRFYRNGSGCNDLNLLIQQQGYFAFRGDFRIGNLNQGCPLNTRPMGVGWGLVCVNNSFANNPTTYPFNGHRGQQCSVLTDTHCNCRPVTAGLGTNPSVTGICW